MASASRALPRGLRIQQRRKPPWWLGLVALLVLGVALGFGLAGAPPAVVLGTLAALVAIGAAIYRPALGFAVFAVSYPFDLTSYAGPLKVTTSEALLLILAAILIGRHLLRDPPPVYRTPLDIPVLLFAGATVLSLLSLTGFYGDQLVALVKATGGFVVFFIVTQSLHERRDLWLVVLAVLMAGLILATETAVQAIGGGTISVLDRATGNVIDPNLFAGYLVLLVPLALGAGIAMPWRWGPLVAGAMVLLLGAALVATLSRGGWLGFVVGVAVMAILLPGRRRVVLGVGLGATAVLLIGLAGPVAARLGTGAGASPLQTLLDRIPIWQAAWTMFAQHPVFGIGLDNFGNFIGAINPDLDVNQAHNLFLNIAAERGLLGLLTFVVVLGMSLVTLGGLQKSILGLATSAPHADSILVAAITASIAAFVADSLFDVAYYDYKILLLFWLVLGIGATLPRILSPRLP